MPTENPLLQAALSYARLGWRLVPLHNQVADGRCTCQAWRDEQHAGPCRTPGKHPRFTGYAARASANEDEIRAWWVRYPRANVGLIAGPESGFWALDTDPRNGGDDNRGDLMVQHGRLPYTTTNRTGGGGTHELWIWPADLPAFSMVELADGLEALGAGHVVIAPPSRHPSGRDYAWEPELGPDEMMPQPAPEWLIALVRAKAEAAAATPAPTGPRADFKPVPVAPILDGCAWLRHCRDDAAALQEPEWYAMLAVVGRCVDGDVLAHEFSKSHKTYSPAGTAAKLRQAIQNAGPTTCLKVRNSLGCGRYCEECPNVGRVKSPIVLANAQMRLPEPPPLNLDETGIPGAVVEASIPSTASGANAPAPAIAEADIEAAVDAAIAANDPLAALAIAAQLVQQSEFTVARVKLRLREHFGRRLSMRDFERVCKGETVAVAPAKSKARAAGGGSGASAGGSGGGGGYDDRLGWQKKLLLDSHFNPLANLANAITALESAPEWRGVLWRDEFAECTVIRDIPPPIPLPKDARTGRWQNLHDTRTAEWLQHSGINVSVQVVTAAVEAVAHQHRFHPVREYLNGLVWDGEERLDGWLGTYLCAGAGDSLGEPEWARRTAYFRAVGSKWMISAVARVFQPGCKADCVLIIEGEQGKKKSSALRVLGGEWFTDQIEELGSKDAAFALPGAWLIEIAELESMTKSEVGAVKAFFSRARDRYRPAYAARLVEVPRQCVFAGTANGGLYLRDETGGRRFWPVWAREINLDWLQRDRDQLWAEAVARYRAGATWWLDAREVVAQADVEQADRYRGDPWDPIVLPFIADLPEVTMDLLLGPLCLDIPKGRWSQTDYNRVAAILRAAGWRKLRRRASGDRGYVYRPQQAADPAQESLINA